MERKILGIHHVTAIAGDPRRNVDFYTGILGLRLVKKTVNFDDPNTYHLYYGDELGMPGTIITFFPWPGAFRGKLGSGQVTTTSFSVPERSLGHWAEYLSRHGVTLDGPKERFAEEFLTLRDPDGLQLELVAHVEASAQPRWEDGPVPPEHAIRGFYSVVLYEQGYESTVELLTEAMGFRLAEEDGDRFRFVVADGGPGTRIDLLCAPGIGRGRVAVGSVHHVAWRVADDEAQAECREILSGRGLNVTPVLDRKYFRSIYFREPGGVLFEIATDPPGFTVDEGPEDLGSGLMLPPWLEGNRDMIERKLPELRGPKRAGD